jgi:ABC-2 type transport system permease protein
MSNNGVPPLFTTISTSIRTGMWFTLLIVMAATSLLIVALTVSSREAAAPGTDAGRMAFSFVIFLVLVATLLGTPTVFISIRERLGQLSFLHTYLLTVAVGLSFVVVAVPAMLWAVLSTSVGVDVWLPVIGTTALELGAIALLVALAHWALTSASVATVTAFGLIAGITLGPVLVLATASFAPPITQSTKTYFIKWDDPNEPMDPDTGYPLNPVCEKSPVTSTTMLTDYTNVSAIIATTPLAFISASIIPAIGDYGMPGWEEPGSDTPPTMPAVPVPLDLFSAIDVASRSLQIPVQTDPIIVDECANLAEFGTAYPNNGEVDPRDVIAETRSGFVAGLIGQGAFLVVATVILSVIRARTRRS